MTIVYALAAILIFGVLIAVHELGHFLAAKLCGVQVNEFSIGMGPCLLDRQKGETQYSLRLLPIGGFCAMEGEEEHSDNPRALNNQGFWKKFVIFAAGAFMNLLTGFVVLLVLYSGAQAFKIPEVAGVAPEFQEVNSAVLEDGDRIWAINGERVYLYGDVSLLLNLGKGEPIDMTVLRDGEKITLRDVPRQTYTGTDGEPYQGYGFYIANNRLEMASPATILKAAWLNTLNFARIVRLSLQMLLTGQASMDDVSGPVGIVTTITQVGKESESVQEAVDNILYFAALIAVNLAVMNLLPIPALDGGHIFFLVVDTIFLKLFRKKIPDRYETALSGACFALLMGFMLVVTFHDVFKLFR